MKNKHINDILLILGVFAVAAVILIFGRTGVQGSSVEVRYGGEIIAKLPLNVDREFDIGDVCRLSISNGQAKMAWASCKNQICVKHRAISNEGESIVCLTNGVTVIVTGSGVDFYS